MQHPPVCEWSSDVLVDGTSTIGDRMDHSLKKQHRLGEDGTVRAGNGAIQTAPRQPKPVPSSLLLLLWIITVIAGLFPVACMAAEQPATAPIAVTDCRGRQLILKQPARRIVCLIESALSGLFMLGAEDRVVGVSTNVYQGSVYPWYAAMDTRIAAGLLPAIGNWDFVNLERVVALQPDLVIIWSHQEESIQALEERGIPVFGVFISTFADIYREILALGELTGARERAQDLVDYSRQEVLRITRQTEGVSHRPRVFYMWAQGELETSGGKSTVDELIRLAGGDNIFGGIDQEHLVVNREKVLARDPEVIIMWYNERKDPEDIIKSPLWQHVRAVQTQRIHEFPDVFSCDLWTLKFLVAVQMVAKWCHPGGFGGMDLQQLRAATFQKLYGKKYPVNHDMSNAQHQPSPTSAAAIQHSRGVP